MLQNSHTRCMIKSLIKIKIKSHINVFHVVCAILPQDAKQTANGAFCLIAPICTKIQALQYPPYHNLSI